MFRYYRATVSLVTCSVITVLQHILEACASCPLNLHRLSQLVDALQLLQGMVGRERTFALNLTISLPHQLFGDIVLPLTEFSAHMSLLRQRGSILSRKYADATSGHDLDATLAST